ncbi:MAG TPA: DUF1285 domain-containing protein [Methylomirabilota bacterium]|nr:DUF1285 domain-containing protein [Methylomirabilota bacterium]
MMTPSDPASWKLPRLRIDRDGVWYAEEGEVSHPGILANFVQNLRVDAQGHYLQIGPARVPVDVEDAPFVVLRLERDGDGFAITLNDMTREALDPTTLTVAADGVPHCRVKGARFTARLSRAATWQLLQHVAPGGPGRAPALVVGGVRHPLSGLTEAAAGD